MAKTKILPIQVSPKIAHGIPDHHESLTNPNITDYNMPVLQADAPTIINVVNGSVLANNVPTSYEASFIIGGQFNEVAKTWIDTFPSGYPYDRTQYDEGCSVYSLQQLNSTTNNWSAFGYNSSTQSTGSDGWVFWQSGSSSTTTSTKNTVDINEESFSNGIKVSAWGIGQFPIEFGQWCKFLDLSISPLCLPPIQFRPFVFR
jgi:hypothetical protein